MTFHVSRVDGGRMLPLILGNMNKTYLQTYWYCYRPSASTADAIWLPWVISRTVSKKNVDEEVCNTTWIKCDLLRSERNHTAAPFCHRPRQVVTERCTCDFSWSIPYTTNN